MDNQTDNRGRWGHKRPRLADGVSARRSGDGQLVLMGPKPAQTIALGPVQESIVALLDGDTTLDEIVARALTLADPVRPMDVLGLMRRLWHAGILDGLGADGDVLLGERSGGGLWSRLRDIRLYVRGLAALVGWGRALPYSVVRVFHALSAIIAALALAWVLWNGDLVAVLAPLSLSSTHPARDLLGGFWILSVVMSWRGFQRGVTLSALGATVPRAGLRILYGIPFFDVEDRERWLCDKHKRRALAVAGLAPMTLTAGVFAWGWILGDSEILRVGAAVSFLVLIIDAAPYLRSDGHEVLSESLATDVMGRRSLSYALRRVAQNLKTNAHIDGAEGRMLLSVALWTIHAAVLLQVLGGWVLPGAIEVASGTLNGPSATDLSQREAMLAFAVATLVVGAILAFFGSLAVNLLLTLLQLLSPRMSATPVPRRRLQRETTVEFVQEACRIPLFCDLDPEELEELAEAMRSERFHNKQVIAAQGERPNRFFYIRRGRCQATQTDASGRTQKLASLGPGDFFGEVALLEDSPRTATISARGPVEVMSLDRESFAGLMQRIGAENAEQLTHQVSTATFLRSLPTFAEISATDLGEVLSSLELMTCGPNHVIVEQGQEASDLYVVFDGEVEVVRDHQSVAKLGRGELFGEIALLTGEVRPATIRTTIDTRLFRIPAPVFHHVLLTNFHAAIHLDDTVNRRIADWAG